jgi:hypothetical protein
MTCINRGEFYADLDDATGLYCVFHTETSRAYSSWATMRQAQESADTLNEGRAI